MKSDHKEENTLSLEMPIYDGSEPPENLLPDSRTRQIYTKLLRQQEKREKRLLTEAKQWMSIELVLKALIIGEYMDQQGIQDITKGIKQFSSFQHEQLMMLSMRMTPMIGASSIQ
jgi:hypothetical protein